MTPAPSHAPDGLPTRQSRWAFLSIAIAMSMSVLDASIVNIALPTIGDELGIQAAESVWVVNAYQLALTMALLPLASLGDRLGYKRVYFSGLVVFTLASAVCAQAHTLTMLAAGRMLQGLGAAGAMSVNIALIRFIFPRSQLGAGIGAMALVVASGSVAGPSIASAILTLGPWPWLFLINLPLGLLACVLTWRFLPATPVTGRAIEPWSLLLNALTFGPLIAGLAQWGQGGHPAIAAALTATGLAMGLLFVRYERRLAEPLLPLDLLRRPVFALSLATSMASFAAQTLGMLALPFYFERSLGLSESATGLLMTPWPLATALVAPWAGRWSDRLRPERISSIGLLIMGSGLALLALLGADASSWDVIWRVACCGLGFGIFQSPNIRVIIESAPRERSGGASGIQSMGRTLGQSLGAVMVALIFTLSREHPTRWMCALAAALTLVAALASGLRRTSLRPQDR